MTLQAPFPYFGGKRTVAAEIWSRFGQVQNYIEPFFGSGAVLLARPAPWRGVETVNDLDGMIANFWRATKHDPGAVAEWADWPVSEADLHARHYWLITEGRERLARVLGEPDGHDAKVAGWWLWGACSWIGSGWCSGDGPWQWCGEEWGKNAGQGVVKQLPNLGNAGSGIGRQQVSAQDWIAALSKRLRNVRIAHGDWSRVTGDSVTWRHGTTAVFLDPPYDMGVRAKVYAMETDVSAAVRAWAIEAGARPDMLICLAGYQGEHDMPPDWSVFSWKAKGGFGNQSDKRGRENAAKETLWFSPACAKAAQVGMDF